MFVIGTLALCGVPPLSGFYSKDGILHLTHEPPEYAHDFIITILPTLTAVLTSYYMTRLVLLTFFGKPRAHHKYDHAHEAPASMTVPMMVLCVLAVIGGPLLLGPDVLEHFRAATRPAGTPELHYVVADGETIFHALLIFGVGAGSALLAFGLKVIDPERIKQALGPVHAFIDNRWYIDDLYAWIVENVQQNVARLCDGFDRFVIIGTFVNGSAWTARAAGAVVARVQTGSVRVYALVFLAGVAALLALNL
jgi:NADH-quinone oxidoreductase subunit L